jgi:hypothetical protein
MRFVPLSGSGLIFGVLLVLGLLLIPPRERFKWVGVTDLEIECVVTDAVTGEPLKGATVQVRSEGGLWAERDEQQFSLVTDAGGSVKRLCKECLCFGTSGRNIDTYFVHLPWWYYQATAPGYAPSEWTYLDTPENVRQVQRGKPAAKLVVRTELKKKPAEPGAAADRRRD